MRKRKWITFSKRTLKNNETTEQEQNTSLNPKEIISPEPFATNTMTKKPVSLSHLKLKQTESPTIRSMTEFTIKK